MATEVGEGGRLGMEVWECEIATLEIVVAFMYGVEVPEDFADLQGLLELGDRFLLEELKEEAGRRIAQHIDAQNFRWGLAVKPVSRICFYPGIFASWQMCTRRRRWQWPAPSS